MTTESLSITERLAAISGLISNECGEYIRSFARMVQSDLAIVELGAFKGKSSCYLAQGTREGKGSHVYSIDPWDSDGNLYGKHGFTDPAVREAWQTNIDSLGLTQWATPIKGFSTEVAKEWNKPIGMLYIDGGHTFGEVKADYEAFSRWLAPDAIVVWDDYAGPNVGVSQYVDILRKAHHLVDWDMSNPPMVSARMRNLTDVTLSASVMAHKSRARFEPYWRQKLGDDIQIVWDEKDNRWDTGRRNMLAHGDTTHHIVVQDDALICEDFLEGVRRSLLTVPPDVPVSYYTGRVRPSRQVVDRLVNEARQREDTWITMDGPMWGVAVCLPVVTIEPMLKYSDTLKHISNYDLRMARYYMRQGTPCYYSLPSLVSHRTGVDNPSLVPGRGNSDGRVAHKFIGEDTSALDVQWRPLYQSKRNHI